MLRKGLSFDTFMKLGGILGLLAAVVCVSGLPAGNIGAAFGSLTRSLAQGVAVGTGFSLGTRLLDKNSELKKCNIEGSQISKIIESCKDCTFDFQECTIQHNK